VAMSNRLARAKISSEFMSFMVGIDRVPVLYDLNLYLSNPIPDN